MINPHLQHELDIKVEAVDPIEELQWAYERLQEIAGEKECRRFVASISKYGNIGPQQKTRMINTKIAELTEIPY